MDESVRLLNGDCVEMMRGLADASVDAVVTDPPYELGFMGKGWDASGIAYSVEMWREVLRVLKPGGHLLAFGGTRTYHRMAVAIEDAGFEIRDSIHWVYGSGFPKSLDVSKAIDKATGAEREVIGTRKLTGTARIVGGLGVSTAGRSAEAYVGAQMRDRIDLTAPATDAAKAWDGWGTALKPAHEPVVVARKPLIGTVAANVTAHGTGALNIDACRVAPVGQDDYGRSAANARGTINAHAGFDGKAFNIQERDGQYANAAGRWPPNILLSHTRNCGEACAEDCAVAEMDRQGGGASRFFPVFRYQAKASKSDRGQGNVHPTVKPVALMAWLVKLVTPPGGVVLDPFMGSGTTGVAARQEGKKFIGIEREPQYFEICKARIGSARVSCQADLFAEQTHEMAG